MVKVDADYRFEGPKGTYRFVDLFEGRRQLYVHHFMWIDAKDTGCPSCTRAAQLHFTPPVLEELNARDVTFCCISRIPYGKIAAYARQHGFTFPWYSSFGTRFSYDLHASLDESQAPIEFNYRNKAELLHAGFPESALHGDWPANSVFLRHGDDVFHTYTAYARGLDQLSMPYNFLDLTVYGRQEDWEDSPPGWPQKPTYG